MSSPKLVTTVIVGCLLLSLTGCMGFSSGKTSQNSPADFSVAINPGSATVAKGGKTSVNASIAALGNFVGTVQLALTGAPSGVTANLSSSSVDSSGEPTVSITTSKTVSAGTYHLTLWAASGSLSHSANLNLVVSNSTAIPDFSISTAPSSQTIAAGQSTSFNVSVAALNGFTGTVSLTASGLPSGMQATFSPASISTSGTATLNVSTTTSVAAGSYSLTVAGANGTLNHSTTVAVTVSATAPPPDFSMSASPASQSLTAGSSTSFNVTVSAVNGFTGIVALAESGMPAGMIASCTPGSITGSGTCTLNVATSTSTAAGTYTLTITGTSGTLVHSANIAVTVRALTAPPDFTLSSSPASQSITAGSSTSFNITISATNGFTGIVALAESGMPAGMVASCTPGSITGSGTCTLNVATSTSTAAGTYTLTITGTSGTLVHSANIAVTVTAVTAQPDFTLSSSPSSQSITAGNSTAYSIAVSPVNGFTGTVVLSIAGLPSGVSATFSPASIAKSGSSTLAVSVPSSTTAGTYGLTISGQSGNVVHAKNASLTVAAAITGASMNVMQFPGATSDPWFKDAPTYLFNNPTVSGATIGIEWSGIDQGPSAGSNQYDWSYVDGLIQPWIQAGKKVNLVTWAVADSSSNLCGQQGQYGTQNIGNCALPTYIWNLLGSSNETVCTSQYGTQQMPNYLAPAFQNNYRAFIAAVFQHFNNNSNIGYIRVGLGHGGETIPVGSWYDTTTACGQAYVNQWGYTTQSWESYLSTMLSYEASLNPTMQLMVGITPLGTPNSGLPAYVAGVAVPLNIGFGSQGLQESDVNNCVGGTNWCALFAQYTPQVPLELQTIGQSCPDKSCPTGSLVDTIPFAIANHATVFELYYEDWLVAYDPNYPGYFPAYQPVLKAAAGK